MDFLESLKIVLSLIVVENFFYKYYIGVNFFTELHKRDMNKEKIAINFALILGISSIFLFSLKKVYHLFLDSDIGYLILIILATFLTIIIYNKFVKQLENHLYYSVNNFLLLSIIENRFDSYLTKLLAVAIIPLFYYFNLVILEPLLKNLNYKKSLKYVKKDALVIIVISIVGLLLNAFEGF